eukprot:SAG25_NODE_8330_length_428_cov_1.100610_1_plen_50_part_10
MAELHPQSITAVALDLSRPSHSGVAQPARRTHHPGWFWDRAARIPQPQQQ